jgi:hypothetical protein
MNMANTVSAKMQENLQQSKHLIPESQSCILSSSVENQRTSTMAVSHEVYLPTYHTPVKA